MIIRNVTLVAANRSYSYDLHPGVNLIVGPVGTGKTSLLELIRYGLGGNAQLSPAVLQVGRQLALTVDVGDEKYLLLRGVANQRRRIAVHSPDGRPITTVTAGAPGDSESISSLLMRTLGIPEVRVPTSRRKPAGKFTTVSFNDVFAYMYLPQHEIDRSTVNHLDPVRDPKRRSTFEVLYGLIDAEIARTQVDLGQLGVDIAEARSGVIEVERFLDALDLPPRSALLERLATQDGQAAARERELELTRERMRTVGVAAEDARRRVERVSAELAQAQSRRDRAAEQLDELSRLRAQVVLDEQRTIRSMLAGSQLAAIEFRTCPRCLQEISDRPVVAGHCLLCSQPEPSSVAAVTLEDEAERLRGQLAETDQLIAEAAAMHEAAASGVAHLRQELAEVRSRADRESRDAVAPFVDRVAVLSEELGALRGLREASVQALATHEQLRTPPPVATGSSCPGSPAKGRPVLRARGSGTGPPAHRGTLRGV